MEIKAPFPVSLQSRVCSDLAFPDMQQIIAALNARATEIGCTIFPAGTDTQNVFVLFASAGGECFSALSLAIGLDCEVIYFQDCHSAWYQGSSILPPVQDIVDGFLKQRIGGRRPLFFGQSSGAYACLVAARAFPQSVTIACSPQTFADFSIKDRLNFIGDIKVYKTLPGLTDLVAHWRDADFGSRYVAIVCGAGEGDNPVSQFYWLDHLHLAHLLNVEAFSFYVVAAGEHALVRGRAKAFSEFLRDAVGTPASHMPTLVAARLLKMFGPDMPPDIAARA
jgi:hypothetical protein